MVEYTASQTIRISFEDNDTTWKTALPEVFQVSDITSLPWTVSDTFLYEDATTFRSGAIGGNGTTTVDLTFTLVSEGGIEFAYSGQSESNYDWFTVLIDDEQVLRVSGTRGWDVFSQELDPGDHTLRLTYSKDRSGNVGLDAYAIGYIELSGVWPTFNNWYLIRNDVNDLFYKEEEDGALEEVAIVGEEPTLEEFRLHGNTSTPTTGILTNVPKHTILKCLDTGEFQEYGRNIIATIRGNMKPTLMQLSPPIQLLETYQIGFNSVQVNATYPPAVVIKFVISYDGFNWYSYIDNTWEEVDYTPADVLANGMTDTFLNSLGNIEYSQLYTAEVPLNMYIALVMSSSLLEDWSIRSVRVSFATDL